MRRDYLFMGPVSEAVGYVVSLRPYGETPERDVYIGMRTSYQITLGPHSQYGLRVNAIGDNHVYPAVVDVIHTDSTLDLGDDLFDDLDENDFNLLAANFVA